ncbi:MAG: cellulase family glycosylhydrolase [Bdellovibrionales bacterium]|nr:cellulase family glycosylhydrolase [Bdellovibrionales bacterium]
MTLQTRGPWFTDAHGRRILLRGINVAGSSKIPFGADIFEPAWKSARRAFTFTGRPFPLTEADAHYARLREWGFNCIRFLVTWEAIEPREPGVYDEAYLEYLRAVVQKAGEYGFYVFIDPHQDAWSRFSGGDGAPAWTLDLAGFRLDTLDASEAAINFAERYPHYETMVWPNNWGRLASCTMFTLFFAGARLAPDLKVGSESIQSVLQNHFIEAMFQVALRMRDLPHVIGYDSLNEPSPGYIGLASLSTPLPVYNSAPQLTGLQSLSIPAGFPTTVPFMRRTHLEQRVDGSLLLNPESVSAWKSPAHDIWRYHGVWDVDARGQPHILQDNYFATVKFFRDGLEPFARKYAESLRHAHPSAILFIEGEPGGADHLSWNSDIPVVNASHWYDLLTLITKRYDPAAALVWGSTDTVRGEEAVRESFRAQIAAHVNDSRRYLNNAPTLIGEFGLPMDMNGREAFGSGDFSAATAAYAAYYDALDANLAHSALWNYTPDNTNARGDLWNQEDLSIYSADQGGARALLGFCRPTVRACAGTPLAQSFDPHSGRFEFQADLESGTSEFFIPRVQYPNGVRFEVTSGQVNYDASSQIAEWSGAAPGNQKLHALRR